MKIEVYNEKYGVVAVENVNEIDEEHLVRLEQLVSEKNSLDRLAFFYMPDYEIVVLNKSHPLFMYYLDIIIGYFEMDEEDRVEVKLMAPNPGFREALEIIDFVIQRRAANGRDKEGIIKRPAGVKTVDF